MSNSWFRNSFLEAKFRYRQNKAFREMDFKTDFTRMKLDLKNYFKKFTNQ